MRIVIIVAPKGGGKGTQARILKERFGFVSVGIGDVLRERRNKPDFPEKYAELMDKSMLLPDCEVVPILEEYLDTLAPGTNLILDGYPRTFTQAVILMDMLHQKELHKLTTVNLKVSVHESAARRVMRRELEKRSDDTDSGIRAGIEEFEREVPAMVAYLKNHTKYFEVDGTSMKPHLEDQVEEVAERIRSALDLTPVGLES